MVTRYLTLGAALAGAADTGQFLVARRHLFRENRRRAGGTLAGVALWSALALSAARERRVRRRWLRRQRAGGRRTLALAGAVGAANGALLAIHLRSRPIGPRVFVGPALATVALASALASQSGRR